MTKLKIGTFNANNLFLRYKFNKKAKPEDFIKEGGRIDLLGFTVFDEGNRLATAQAIMENKPDIVCLQEIENFETLKKFNTNYLKGKYPYGMLVDGNDPRLIDVGILSKYPIGNTRTHQFDKDKKGKIFSRDCLEADVHDKGGNPLLTVFVNHLKSQFKEPDDPVDPSVRRERQATRVAAIVEERFGDNIDDANFIVLGDMNDSPNAECMQPLLGNPWLENVVARRPSDEQWTYYYYDSKEKKGYPNQYDYLLFSKALADNNPKAIPDIERRGLANKVKVYNGSRFPGVGKDGTQASDHCPVFIDFEI
jgi:endonuclease/exonuclease/phosphatase family metal-dependent hydrolase